MFLTVTPNLCIERTVEIPDFCVSEVHRVTGEKLHVNAGGKGINAARIASRLDAGVLALSWVGKHQRAWFESQLTREGVPFELIEVETDTRICTNILHGQNQKTEIIEDGAPLCAEDGAMMLTKFDAALPACDLTAICGSYPVSQSTPGGSAMDLHLSEMAKLARSHSKRLIVDGKGVAFKLLLKSTYLPWAIKPNSEEAAALLGFPIQNQIHEIRALEELLHSGVEVVLLSCGGRGAWLGTKAQKVFFSPPRVTEVSAVGSGDSFVGAFAAQYLRSGDLIEATRWGIAAGAANAAQKLSAFCTRDDIEVLLPQVGVQEF